MCELFGYEGKNKKELNDILKIFYSHSCNHPHGWGMADLGSEKTIIMKEPLEASKSSVLKERLSSPICSRKLFGHIRYATIGNIECCNCHPFVRYDESGREWVLIHNGTIFDFDDLTPYIKLQKGDTDSERILYYIVDCINKSEKNAGRKLNRKERFDLIDDITVRMSKGGNKLNFILSDGQLTYVHYNLKGTLHFKCEDDGITFSTLPLDADLWETFPFMKLMAYEKGSLVFCGTQHENEYFENENRTRLLYQIFAGL